MFAAVSLAISIEAAAAIAAPSAIPPWRSDRCVDMEYGLLDTANVRITTVSVNGHDVIAKFRVELFTPDPTFPELSNHGLIITQLDDRPVVYIGSRFNPSEDVILAYTNVDRGNHRVAIELGTAYRGRHSVAVKCFTVP